MLFGILPHSTDKIIAFRDLDDLKRNVASNRVTGHCDDFADRISRRKECLVDLI